MSFGPIDIAGERRRLVCPPVFRVVDSAGRMYIGKAYAYKPFVAFVTYVQSGDHQQYLSAGRQALPLFDPLIEKKCELANAVRSEAYENADRAGLKVYDDDMYEADLTERDFKKNLDIILDEVIENEIYQIGTDEGLRRAVLPIADLVDYYATFIEEYCAMNEYEARVAANKVIKALETVLNPEYELK
ncbi:hypothetical protein [Candidatus Methanocrinis natronophilus]|uniref:Uncharacterized protein n=1 Tax=Candidatus Methanocrinis natronophilus TaxID=3033396 RepID=A0ABT5X4Q5_9EURY|nr:hypothetical protein [Candidatus Methanocrinis natronophilus]MDF0589680.1 hypothetical protein [Candidatus Methanocrinis natronophilus]